MRGVERHVVTPGREQHDEVGALEGLVGGVDDVQVGTYEAHGIRAGGVRGHDVGAAAPEPARDVEGRLWGRGANVVATDPAGAGAVRLVRPDLHIVDTADEALEGADLVMLLTAWRDYVALDPAHAKSLVAVPRMIDGRNALDAQAWSEAGWDYRGMGRTAYTW